jgi:hypothetical protein
LAREIAANQQQQITVMRNAVSEEPSAPQSPQQPRAQKLPQSARTDGPDGMKMSQ